MTLDAKMRSTASRLLAKFGKAVPITVVVKTYSPSSGAFTVTSTTTTTVNGAVSEFSAGITGNADVISGDLKVTIAAMDLTQEPLAGDTVVIDGQTYKVINVFPTYSGELVALWKLQVRK